MSLSTSVSLLV